MQFFLFNLKKSSQYLMEKITTISKTSCQKKTKNLAVKQGEPTDAQEWHV